MQLLIDNVLTSKVQLFFAALFDNNVSLNIVVISYVDILNVYPDKRTVDDFLFFFNELADICFNST